MIFTDNIVPTPDTPTTVLGAVMVLGSVIVAGLVVTIRYLLKAMETKATKIETLLEAAIAREAAAAQREREISREEGPLLAAAAEALKATPEAFERAVGKVVDSTTKDQVMRRLELAVDDLTKKWEDRRRDDS